MLIYKPRPIIRNETGIALSSTALFIIFLFFFFFSSYKCLPFALMSTCPFIYRLSRLSEVHAFDPC